MFREWDGGAILIGVLFTALLAATIYGVYIDNRQWDAFSQAHHCKLVSHMDGSNALTTGIAGNGQVVVGSTYIPGKDGYLCDDGVTYYRDN